jgi:hypothetical protein
LEQTGSERWQIQEETRFLPAKQGYLAERAGPWETSPATMGKTGFLSNCKQII